LSILIPTDRRESFHLPPDGRCGESKNVIFRIVGFSISYPSRTPRARLPASRHQDGACLEIAENASPFLKIKPADESAGRGVEFVLRNPGTQAAKAQMGQAAAKAGGVPFRPGDSP
jgi:hypothetical protein